jgi:hypothetical protein
MKKIKKIAEQIVELEKNIELGKDVQSSQQKIENIILSLSFKEVLELDDYIFKKNLLTK